MNKNDMRQDERKRNWLTVEGSLVYIIGVAGGQYTK